MAKKALVLSLYRSLLRASSIYDRQPQYKLLLNFLESFHDKARILKANSHEFKRMHEIWSLAFSGGWFYRPFVSFRQLVKNQFRKNASIAEEGVIGAEIDLAFRFLRDLNKRTLGQTRTLAQTHTQEKTGTVMSSMMSSGMPPMMRPLAAPTQNCLLIHHPSLNFFGDDKVFQRAVLLLYYHAPSNPLRSRRRKEDMEGQEQEKTEKRTKREKEAIKLSQQHEGEVTERKEKKERDHNVSMGLIINRPYPKPSHPNYENFDPEQFYLGGPVDQDVICFLHPFEFVKNAQRIADGLYKDGDLSHVNELIRRGVIDGRQIKFFAGHCVWDIGQLASECENNCWFISQPTISHSTSRPGAVPLTQPSSSTLLLELALAQTKKKISAGSRNGKKTVGR